MVGLCRGVLPSFQIKWASQEKSASLNGNINNNTLKHTRQSDNID